MKKLFVLLSSFLFLWSCEQDDFIVDMSTTDVTEESVVQTRTATSIADFDPLKELEGIPLNIVNVGNSDLKYLSAEASGTKVKLVNDDDESGRQRWYLWNGGQLVLKKGNELCGTSSNPVVLSGNKGAYDFEDPTVPVLQCDNRFDSFGVKLISANDNYQMQWRALLFGSGRIPLYLQPSSENNANLSYKKDLSGDYSQWQIIPVGEYRLVDVKYEKSVELGDYILENPRYCEGVVIQDVNHVVEQTMEVNETFSVSSEFSETQGLTVQNQLNSNWGFEVPLVHISFGGSVSSTITSNTSTTFGNKENYSISIKNTFKVQVPPHSPCRIEICEMQYTAKLTYVMTVEKVDGEDKGKQFRVKGTWSGTVCSDLYYNVYDIEDDSKVLATEVILPNTETITISENIFK